MSESIFIMWIDDEKTHLEVGIKLELLDKLRGHGIDARIEIYDRVAGAAEEAIEGTPDLIITDLIFDNSPRPSYDGFEVIRRLVKRRNGAPIVVFTAFREKYLEEAHRLDNVLGVFDKNNEGIYGLVSTIVEVVARPPVRIVAFSDIHYGNWARTESQAREWEGVVNAELVEVRRSQKVDYLMVAGDLSWRGQESDLRRSETLLRKMRVALGVKDDGRLHFCPGNHDVDRTCVDEWQMFSRFIQSMSSDDSSIFMRYSDRQGNLRKFYSQSDFLAVSQGVNDDILVASLNSMPGKSYFEEGGHATLGRDQLADFRNQMANRVRKVGQVRIALLHHPVLPMPGSVQYPDVAPLDDSTDAIGAFRVAGVNLVIHGHAHYSAVTELRSVRMNAPGQDLVDSGKLVIVSLPTIGGEAHDDAPVRQYFMLTLGHYRPHTRTRLLRVQTRILDWARRCFVDGASCVVEVE